MLKKRLSIISLVMKIDYCYLKKTPNFGIEVPKSVAQAYALDKNNGNTLWAYAISKEMKDVSPTSRKLDNAEILPIGYQRVNCHMVFDVWIEKFRRKARFVSGEHVTESPATTTYASVVSR